MTASPSTPKEVIVENLAGYRDLLASGERGKVADWILTDLAAYGFQIVDGEEQDHLIESGDVYAWRGIPGQHATERFIRIDSMTARCEVNAAILVSPEETAVGLCSIGLADLEVALRRGFLVKVET